MRILIATDNRFWRRQIGSQQRIASLCNHFADQGHQIDILFIGYLYPEDRIFLTSDRFPFGVYAFGWRTEHGEARNNIIKSMLLPIHKWARKSLSMAIAGWSRRRSDALPTGNRRLALQLQEPKLKDFIDNRALALFSETCSRIQPELILIEYVRLSYLLSMAHSVIPPGCRTLIDTHDVQHERQSRYHDLGQVHDIDISATEEATALALADAVIAIHTVDAQKFRAIRPSLKILVAGFPMKVREHVREQRDDVVRIGFFGSDMAPNRDAAMTLLRYFYELRCELEHRVELHIFGKLCAALATRTPAEGVHFHGFVEDLDEAYAGLDIVANPIAYGGGLKIKNIEALCHGLALITTSVGAEGIEAGINLAFQVADEPGEFLKRLACLVRSPAEREHWSRNALRFAHQNFSENTVYADLDEFIQSN